MSTTTHQTNTFNIIRWDGIISNSLRLNPKPLPAVYIVPDKKLLDYINKKKDNTLALKILNTRDSNYQNKLCYGKIIPSSLAGGRRPNYFMQTGQYVILLDAQWMGYPCNLGAVQILDNY